jgi:hypothetical protein
MLSYILIPREMNFTDKYDFAAYCYKKFKCKYSDNVPSYYKISKNLHAYKDYEFKYNQKTNFIKIDKSFILDRSLDWGWKFFYLHLRKVCTPGQTYNWTYILKDWDQDILSASTLQKRAFKKLDKYITRHKYGYREMKLYFKNNVVKLKIIKEA